MQTKRPHSLHSCKGPADFLLAFESETGVSVNTLLSRKRYAVLRLRERLQSIYDELKET